MTDQPKFTRSDADLPFGYLVVPAGPKRSRMAPSAMLGAILCNQRIVAGHPRSG